MLTDKQIDQLNLLFAQKNSLKSQYENGTLCSKEIYKKSDLLDKEIEKVFDQEKFTLKEKGKLFVQATAFISFFGTIAVFEWFYQRWMSITNK